MATAYAPPLAAHPGGIGPGGNVTTTSSTTPYQQSTKDASGFKVYGSLFKVDARYQFLNPLGKGSYGIVWYAIGSELDRHRYSRSAHSLCPIGIVAQCGKGP